MAKINNPGGKAPNSKPAAEIEQEIETDDNFVEETETAEDNFADEVDNFADAESTEESFVEEEPAEETEVFTDAEVVEEEPQPVKQTPAVAKKLAPAKQSNLSFDLADFEKLPGVVVGDIGVELSRFPVEKVKFSKAYRTRLAIAIPKVIATKTHYIEGVGSFFCFGGKCCQVADLPKVKYNFPVVIYDTNREGKIVSPKIRYGVFPMQPGTYEDLKTMLALQEGTLDQFDFLITCKEEKFQDISIVNAGPAKWKTSPKISQEVIAFWKDNLQHILKPIAKPMTEEELTKALGANTQIQNDNVDFSQVF